ncbi:Niemann-Pick C1 protein [Ananas comosus]|uniref:Niemann-Pick C1 protein n=1 Tax=Ananas comosus TaxID=4615 RepID=A0A199VK69_ANACO|nr:Niemann-Pick C1 protein [Ananas comosus]
MAEDLVVGEKLGLLLWRSSPVAVAFLLQFRAFRWCNTDGYISLVMAIILFFPACAQQSNGTSGKIYAEGYCSMYGICGQRSDGKVLNCPNETRAAKPDDLFSAKIQSLCPTISGNVCCTADQFDTLHENVQQAIPFLVGCPACLRNFLNIFCELSCSPNQSLFINVTSIAEVNNTMTVDGIDFFVTSEYGEELYNSCKDVKFGTMNTRSMDFIGGAAQNYTEWFAFLGRQANLNEPGSPYAVSFRSDISDSSGMKPLNITVYSCGDHSLGCSCGDCPSSSVCMNNAPSASRGKRSCSFKMGSLKVKCLEFSLAIVYFVLLAAFLTWVSLHRKRERVGLFSRTEPLQNVQDQNQLHSVSKEELSGRPLQITEEVPLVAETLRPSVVQSYMTSFFRKYGTFVARNPILVLCLSLAVPLLICIGLIRFKVETRAEKLWVGPGSKAAEEKQYFDSHLAPFYRIEQLIVATIPASRTSSSPTIVTGNNIQLLFEVQKKVDGLRANYSGNMVSLSDICFKPLGADCATQSVLQYFQMDPQKYNDLGIDHAKYCFQHSSSDESCLSAFQAPLDPSTALGGFSGNNYSEASAFVITYPVNNKVDKTGEENGKAVAWEEAFIHLMKEEIMPMIQMQNLTLAFSSESSIQEELKRESTADAITILISYLVMFAYISFALGDSFRCSSSFIISSKVLLGLSGVVLVLLSVLGSIGFFTAIGVKSTLIIMEVIPFLVGVDNMCILVHAVKRQPLALSLEGRISNALVEVGPSITLASLSEFLAFAVSTFTPMPACRVFSMFAALAVLLDFLLQVTAFVALIVFDFIRAEAGRVDCVPCIKISPSNDPDKGDGQHKLGFLARYMKEVHAPILGLRGVKVIVIAVFVGFAFTSIALSTRLQPGLEQKIVLPRNSYLQDYFDDLAKYLRIGPPLYFVVKDFNYSLESSQTNQICSISQCNSNSLLNEIAKASLVPESSYIAKPAASWLDDFLIWLSPEAFSCCREFVNGSYCPPDDQCFRHSDLHDGRPSTAQFKEKLPWFLNALPSSDCAKGGKGAYTTNVNLTGYEHGIIQASAFRTYHTPLNKQTDYVNSMKAARDFSSKISDSLQGVMGILDIQLNAISVVNLVMSIGIAVEFCVHITHAFSISRGDRNTRAKEALCTMGASVFSGITLTKLVGVIVLRFARSEVVLSICGPPSRWVPTEQQERQSSPDSNEQN